VFIADDGKDPRTPAEIANDVLIVRPDQGEGYTGYGPAQVWIADLEPSAEEFVAKQIRRLTNDNVWYGDPQWSPDGKTLVVHANKTSDRESVRYSINKNFDLWEINVSTGKQRQLTTGPGPEVSPRFAPDGQRLVCLSIPRQGSHRDVFNLAVVTLDEKPRTRILHDHHKAPTDRTPHAPPTFPLPEDGWEIERQVLYHSEAGTRTLSWQVDSATPPGRVANRTTPTHRTAGSVPVGQSLSSRSSSSDEPGRELEER
jgi:dipeptidyl aminopeptidase/acylaminoacyl peptidase